MLAALRSHWPEYLIEAWGLGTFMICACLVTALLQHPASPVRQAIPNDTLRRVLTGLAMGLTSMSIVYSPWGKQSGAHLNPSMTLTFFRLGKVSHWDALFYVVAQFLGGVAGVMLAAAILGNPIAHPTVNYAVTAPGPRGTGVAFIGELGISFLLMIVVLIVSNNQRIARLTGLCAGALVAIYISLEAPLSGMSMNPARTFGSALPAHTWTPLWIYFVAPPLGMLLAAQLYLLRKGPQGVICAKLHHHNSERCIFRCGYRAEVDG
jgi:aquaporin Z